MGRRAVVLVQTHQAQGADGKTDLLSEPHKQPVDLPPQLPETECAASALTNSILTMLVAMITWAATPPEISVFPRESLLVS